MRDVMSTPVRSRRSRNGHALRTRPVRVTDVVKGWAASFLGRLLLRKSVLIAIGLGTLASWFVKVRFFRPKVRGFRLFW